MNQRRCFVISPIGAAGTDVRKSADGVFRFIIEPAMKEFDITAYRSDHMEEEGNISDQMFREIFQADLCVVLISGYNPNVFYELAIAQAAGRPVILLAEEGQNLPFDIKDLRTIYYDLWSKDFFEYRYSEQVKAYIHSIREKGWENPSLFQLYPYGPKLYTKSDLDAEIRFRVETTRPRPLPPGVDKRYRIPGEKERHLVVLTGSIDGVIEEVKDIHVVVSSENTDLQMARFYDPSISGMLRFLDSELGPDGHVLFDHLNNRLQEAISAFALKLPVRPGTVVAVETTELRKWGIKYVFHLAVVQGEPGEGYRSAIENLDRPVANVFSHFNELSDEHGIETILFPVLGAGTAKRNPQEAVIALLNPIIHQMAQQTGCKTTYVLAWKASHRDALRMAASSLGLEELHV